jgi:hypothetical protein
MTGWDYGTVAYSIWKWIGELISEPLTGRFWSDVMLLWPSIFPWLILLFCFIVASFWVGIFDDLHAAPGALKWGSVGFASLLGLYLLRLLANFLYKIACFGFTKWHDRPKVYYLVVRCGFYFNLWRVGGNSKDFSLLTVLFGPFIFPGAIDLTPLQKDFQGPEFDIAGSVERILKAATKSRFTRHLIRREVGNLRDLVERANKMEDQRPREIIQEIQKIAAGTKSVQELLDGII